MSQSSFFSIDGVKYYSEDFKQLKTEKTLIENISQNK